VIEERTKTNRVNNFVVADYTMGESIIKKKKLNICSVLRAPTTDSINSVPLLIPNTTHKNTVASGAPTMANDGAGGVDIITFVVGGGQRCLSRAQAMWLWQWYTYQPLL
jgi:hypothetical protein